MLYRYLISNTHSTPQCLTVLYVTLCSCSKIDGYEGHVQQRNNATPSHRQIRALPAHRAIRVAHTDHSAFGATSSERRAAPGR
jgi:hypothetical protein